MLQKSTLCPKGAQDRTKTEMPTEGCGYGGRGEICMDRVVKGQILLPTDSKNTQKEHQVNADAIIRGREDKAPPFIY